MSAISQRWLSTMLLSALFAGTSLAIPVEPALREFNTDRPDKTESPYSVDRGHFQFEADILSFTQDRAETGELTRVWNFGQLNSKYGLNHFSDIEVITPLFNIQSTETKGVTQTSYGYGDTTVRYKLNFIGNDGGPFCLGVMPLVKIPTAPDPRGNGRLEVGLIVPGLVNLPRGWSVGFMVQWDRKKNGTDEGNHAEFVSSITLGHDIFGALEGYVEFWSQQSTEDKAGWAATFDAGLVYAVSPIVKLDLGINLGITSAADDWNPFVGASVKF